NDHQSADYLELAKLRKENGTMEDGGVEEEGELRRGKDRNVGQNRSVVLGQALVLVLDLVPPSKRKQQPVAHTPVTALGPLRPSNSLRATGFGHVASPSGDPEVNQGLTGRRNSVEILSTTENSPESTPEAPETEGLSTEPVSQAEVSIVGETLEDMSLSSTSSLDRNDTSREYMDDFDNLGNGGVGIMLLSSRNDEDDSGLDQSCARFDDDKSAINGVTKATGLCFLDDGMDWAAMRLSGERGEHRLTQLSRRRRSSQPDYHDQ
ncbi:serine-rich coiled-coil domain-containing protein 2-like isoform X1, partial [Lates japonicus]